MSAACEWVTYPYTRSFFGTQPRITHLRIEPLICGVLQVSPSHYMHILLQTRHSMRAAELRHAGALCDARATGASVLVVWDECEGELHNANLCTIVLRRKPAIVGRHPRVVNTAASCCRVMSAGKHSLCAGIAHHVVHELSTMVSSSSVGAVRAARMA